MTDRRSICGAPHTCDSCADMSLARVQTVLDLKIADILRFPDGYAESDIVYNWQENNKVGVDKEAHTLPQFEMKNYTTNRRVIGLSTGESWL